VDGVLADRFQIWDHAPWVLLVEEAGGHFSPADPTARTGQGGGLYSNAALHDEVRRAISWRR
jgi:histidinol-phosphatase